MYCPVSSPSKAQLLLALVEVHNPLFPCDGQPRLSKSVLHTYWQDSQPHLSCICRDVQHLFVAYTRPTVNPVSLKSSVLCSGCFGNMWTFTGEKLFMIPKENNIMFFLKLHVFPLYRIAFAPPDWVSVHTQDSCGGAILVTGAKVHLTGHNSGASHIG